MKYKVGDWVTVNASFCELDGKDGQIIAVSEKPRDSMPYMVQFANLREWPFAESELIGFEEQ